MAIAMGIDPGTKSFDLVVIEDDRVIWEKSIETIDIAKNPFKLIDVIEEAGRVDLIAGPSGYGVPVTCNEDIIDPWRFALEVLLLTREEDLKEGIARGEIGIAVYEAIAKVVVELWRKKLPVCYIPSVILLPTVPYHRKINKLDMGTADKLAIAVLAVYDQSKRLSIEYSDTSFILVELGFGYNAVIAVEDGLIVDGLGGTISSTGFLTIGPIDAELAVMGRLWSRSDVFHGGIAEICNTFDISKVIEGYKRGEEPYESALEAMIEGVVKAVYSIRYSVRKPREVILSGRYTRIRDIVGMIRERLEDIAPVVKLKGLENARIAKEAAQGYAVIAEGLAGGFFRDLISYMRIRDASGTVMNYVFHPRLIEAKKKLLDTYAETVKNPML